jgi:site-specific DNA-methyltransferase (adenine-specific)/modification methylase
MDDVTLYNADCLDIMRSLPPVDAVVTDPPYGIAHPCNFRQRGRSNLAVCNDFPDVVGDNVPFDPAPILALDVPTVLWGANHYANKLPPSGGWLVWDKERPDDLDQATCELAWTNCIKGVRRFRYLWNGMMKAGEWGESYHPTQKPVALMKWVMTLRWMPESGATVLDPYMGAGSTGVACVRTGRRFIGIEIDPTYFRIAERRIAEAQLQPSLLPNHGFHLTAAPVGLWDNVDDSGAAAGEPNR